VLRRLYIDNYRSLVNFELALGPVNLLMGANGSGKSSVFAALAGLRRLIHGAEPVRDSFPASSCTRWQARRVQTLELDLATPEGSFHYHLELEHAGAESTVKAERLERDGRPCLASAGEHVEIWGHDSAAPLDRGLVDPSRSGLHLVGDRPKYSGIAAFVRRVGRMHFLSPRPDVMRGWSEGEHAAPSFDLANFASWYRHLSQERAPEMDEAREALRGVLDGFYGLRLKDSGHHEGGRKLVSEWTHGGGKRTSFDFDELSDGQRALIGLYTLLYAGGDDEVTIGVDEPDNFVALPEIQPWLGALSERASLQTLLISHHPEILNLYARDAGLVFRRDDGGPTRVERFTADLEETLTPAELIARGWYRGVQ
jgi:predicted ATPase